MNGLKIFIRKLTNVKGWGYGLFWSWNLVFLAFMALGFAPNVLPETVKDIRDGLIPVSYLLVTVVITLIPVAAMSLGFTLLRHFPGKLLALGYGVEGPLMFLLLVRFFLIRQATAAVNLLYLATILGILTLLWQLLDNNINKHGPFLSYLRIFGLTLLCLMGIYAGVWIAFYAVPLGGYLPELLSGGWYSLKNMLGTGLTWREALLVPLSFFGFILFVYTSTLLIATPIVVPILYVRSWWRGLKMEGGKLGWSRSIVCVGVVGVLSLTMFVVSNRQPQRKAYTLLERLPQTLEQAKVLLKQEETIRAGLLNAYLAPVRYMSAVGEVGFLRELYALAFNLNSYNLSDNDVLNKIERFHDWVARPLLYESMKTIDLDKPQQEQNILGTEPHEASRLYENFFDVPIDNAEKEAIVAAVRSTWSGERALQDWLAVDDREVLLTQQEVNISEHGDWAEVELFEVYQNQTRDQQEVIYYFSLPESAVLTGLWLGNTPDRDERFVFHVAPRGAAQELYRENVRRNIDPALLEQIGPSQYRLRVYPIPPKVWGWDNDKRETVEKPAQKLYLWMTYRVLAEDGAWPLPYLADKYNVYWDKSSARLLNGERMDIFADAWLPSEVFMSEPTPPTAHLVTFPSGQSVMLRPLAAIELPELKNLRLALVLDRSRSMATQETAVDDALTQLQSISQNVDVYLTASPYRGEPASVAKLADLVSGKIFYYGGQNASQLLSQFFALSAGRRSYDAIFVFTDGTGFKLEGEEKSLPVPDAPIWIVHLGGNFPIGYDDSTLQALQASGGGVAGSLDIALTRFAVARQGAVNPILPRRDVLDGFEWLVIPVNGTFPMDINIVEHALDDPFAALAARRLILDEVYRNRSSINELETLDNLHELAVAQGIVTPYSSMIVLVNQFQENRLKALEGEDDRYDRELEEMGETSPDFNVTGVPEPHEWLLLVLSIVMLAWYAWRRRFA